MNTTTDDKQWIEDRMESLTSHEQDLRAAIARGYERGRAAGAEIAQLAKSNHLAVDADRDRLAKRVADLEARLAVADKAEAHARAQVNAYHDIGATTRLGDVESRLAATDARLTALVDLVGLAMELDGADLDEDDARTRLATLRAPGESAVGAIVDALVTDQNAEVAELTRALATARREREEAVGVLRAWLDYRDRAMVTDKTGDPGLTAAIRCARALVAGEAAPSKRDALMTEREADLIGESFAAERELRATIETCRETISRQRAMIAEAQGEVARLTEQLAEAKRDYSRRVAPLVYDAVVADRDALRAKLDAAGRLIERCLDAVDGNHMALRADLRAWGKPS